MAFVPVRDSADLRDVPVVDAKGADSAPLERGVQAAEVLPHPVREHLGLAGDVHRYAVIAVGPPKSARRHRSAAARGIRLRARSALLARRGVARAAELGLDVLGVLEVCLARRA